MTTKRGKTVLKILLALIALVGVLGVAGALWVRSHPLAVHAWTTRQELAKAGLERTVVAAGSGDLVVWQGGVPDGEELMLLHGAGDQAGAWSQVAPALSGDYRLALLDLPGHGDSEPAAGPLPFSTVLTGAEELLATRDRAARDRVTVVGHSMGAWLAMLLAHRHPDRVARVVAVNGGAVRGEPSGVNLLPKDREEARRTMAALRDPESPPIPDFVLDDIVRRAAAGPLGRLMQQLPDMERHLLDGRLGEIAVPVDLLWGESDRHLTVDYAQRLAAELPRARLTTIPRCGHLPPSECPERFLEVLRRTLESAPPIARPPDDTPAPAAESEEEDSFRGLG